MSSEASVAPFPVLVENVCQALSDKYGKDVCLYSGLKVPSSDQVRLVVLTDKGQPRVVKCSCFSSAEALQAFIKHLGKDVNEPEAKRLLLVNGVSKVDKARANTIRQIAAARGKCSPFMSAEELENLKAAREAFLEAEKVKAAAAKDKAKADAEAAKKAEKEKKEGESSPEKVKKPRAPKRKAEEVEAEGVVEPVAEASPKAKRVKKAKEPKTPPAILGQAPEESLSSQVQWSGMPQ